MFHKNFTCQDISQPLSPNAYTYPNAPTGQLFKFFQFSYEIFLKRANQYLVT